MSIVSRRHEFVFLFDVSHGNPNGDPDAGNAPRTDPETGQGLVTDVSIKRKIRDFVALTQEARIADGFDIFVQHQGILAHRQRDAHVAVGAVPGRAANADARAWMCRRFYDVRAFGAVMTTGKAEAEPLAEKASTGRSGNASTKAPAKKGAALWNCGQVQGPVQITMAVSIDPVVPTEHTITRVALTNATDTGLDAVVGADGVEQAASGQMGRKMSVPYGLYRLHGFVTPHFASRSGFTDEDLALLWQSLILMFDLNRSASRGQMSACRLIVFEHDSALGNAPAKRVLDTVTVTRNDLTRPARSFSDYTVHFDRAALPAGVTAHEKL